jgi:hypothetical protein
MRFTRNLDADNRLGHATIIAVDALRPLARSTSRRVRPETGRMSLPLRSAPHALPQPVRPGHDRHLGARISHRSNNEGLWAGRRI